MFLAILTVCLGTDCAMIYNTKVAFLTEEACLKEINSLSTALEAEGATVLDSGWAKVPGQLL